MDVISNNGNDQQLSYFQAFYTKLIVFLQV